MTRTQAIKLLHKLRELVEHPNTAEEERVASIARINKLKSKYQLGTYELGEQPTFGRQRKPPELRRDRVVRFCLTPGEHKKLRELAEQFHMSMSDFIRMQVFAPGRELQEEE